MPVVRIEDPHDARLADYRHLPDPELLRRGEIFVAEGRLVVRTLLARSAFVTRSVLLTDNAYGSLADVLGPRSSDLSVFVVAEGTIEALTGFNLHRGCLAVGVRPRRASVSGLLGRAPAARRLVVLEQIANADNLGGIFRNAAAFGADGVVLGPGCCDPLYRKTIRVSMGAALWVPFYYAGEWLADLDAIRASGITLAALTPAGTAADIGEWARTRPGRLALLAGSEGSGLSAAALAHADVALRVRMVPGVDSLNVATATGIALHACFP
jgi:tRNA G18 (ribose-2'-O)-methylase SpoU